MAMWAETESECPLPFPIDLGAPKTNTDIGGGFRDGDVGGNRR